MIQDGFLLFSDAQNITTAGGLTRSTNTLDTTTPRSIFAGEPMVVALNIPTVAVAPTSLLVEFVHGATTTPATVLATFTLTTLAAGAFHILPIPPGAAVLRYLEVRYTLAGGGGDLNVDAALTRQDMVDNYRAYTSPVQDAIAR